MKCNTSYWSHEYDYQILPPTQDFQLVCISSIFFSVEERQQRLKKYSFSNENATVGESRTIPLQEMTRYTSLAKFKNTFCQGWKHTSKDFFILTVTNINWDIDLIKKFSI